MKCCPTNLPFFHYGLNLAPPCVLVYKTTRAGFLLGFKNIALFLTNPKGIVGIKPN
jgi:hypothetical protein